MPRLIALIFLALTTLAPAAAAQPARSERIEVELVPMSQWVAPGSTAIVALRQQIEPGWHTYWKNPGDSGGATTIDWVLPPDVTAGPILWPLPERQRLQDLVNYGYSGRVFLPVPIEVPASARPGTLLTLRARVTLFVCSDRMCVPEDYELTLPLPVREGAAPLTPRWGEAIQATVEAAPRPAPLDARIDLRDGRLALSVAGAPLAGATPSDVWFYPARAGVIGHAADQTGEYGPEGLTLDLAAGGEVRAAGLAGPVEGVLATSLGAWEITALAGAPLAGTSGEGALGVSDSPGGAGLFVRAVLFALVGGLILNLMPCVFPVLAMKAASLARSAHDPAAARRDGLAFLAGVLLTFLLLAGALIGLRAAGQSVGWGFQLQSPAVVAGLALLFLLIGLNLSGLFEVGDRAQAAAESGPGARLSRLPGGAGAFFTGVLAVVVAAPCTAPFMAFAMGAALTLPAALAMVVFLTLGFGLALPYVLVSFSPRLLARLPRPGSWMMRLKELLAFPMYAAALWLVWVFARQTGMDALALLLAAGLTLALAAWLWGRRQAAALAGRRGPVALIAALAALLTAGALVAMAVRLPVEAAPGPNAAGPDSAPWSPQAVAEAQAAGRPVFVNFTADWCVTCKINERTSLGAASDAFTRSNAVYLVADWTRRDPVIAAELERHGRSGVPLYLVYAPGSPEPRILPQLLTPGAVAEALDAAVRPPAAAGR